MSDDAFESFTKHCSSDLCNMQFATTREGPELCDVCKSVAQGAYVCRGNCPAEKACWLCGEMK